MVNQVDFRDWPGGPVLAHVAGTVQNAVAVCETAFAGQRVTAALHREDELVGSVRVDDFDPAEVGTAAGTAVAWLDEVGDAAGAVVAEADALRHVIAMWFDSTTERLTEISTRFDAVAAEGGSHLPPLTDRLAAVDRAVPAFDLDRLGELARSVAAPELTTQITTLDELRRYAARMPAMVVEVLATSDADPDGVAATLADFAATVQAWQRTAAPVAGEVLEQLLVASAAAERLSTAARSYAAGLRESTSESCLICLENVLDGEGAAPCWRLLCGHSFHSRCAHDWLALRGTCPTCRRPADGLTGFMPVSMPVNIDPVLDFGEQPDDESELAVPPPPSFPATDFPTLYDGYLGPGSPTYSGRLNELLGARETATDHGRRAELDAAVRREIAGRAELLAELDGSTPLSPWHEVLSDTAEILRAGERRLSEAVAGAAGRDDLGRRVSQVGREIKYMLTNSFGFVTDLEDTASWAEGFTAIATQVRAVRDWLSTLAGYTPSAQFGSLDEVHDDLVTRNKAVSDTAAATAATLLEVSKWVEQARSDHDAILARLTT
ncbi:RING finger protein [Lentzea aerocolonigenes]|nr:RING finger protein [Lentzea aerocolonigenes]